MVDALHEIWRVLATGGILVDLRPLPSASCPLELVNGAESRSVGHVDLSGTLADDLAADRVAAQVVRDGLFRPRSGARFRFEFSWDTVAEMRDYLSGSRRVKRVAPSDARLQRLQREWRAGRHSRVHIRYWRPMLLAVYRRLDSWPNVRR